MKIAVVSYSWTGNNTRYAQYLANALSAQALAVRTIHPVTYGSVTLDIMLQRKPKIDLAPDALHAYDLVLIVGPVWMGKVAFPLRCCLDMLKRNRQPYAFLSVSGGADGDNPLLAKELKQRTGSEPVFVLDQHIRELLPGEPKPTRGDTSNYRLSDADCALFSQRAVEAVSLYVPGAL